MDTVSRRIKTVFSDLPTALVEVLVEEALVVTAVVQWILFSLSIAQVPSGIAIPLMAAMTTGS